VPDTVLIFPAGMPRSLAYLERALSEGKSVVGSSSLGHDLAREHYPNWVHLPYLTDPNFDEELRQVIIDYDIGRISANREDAGICALSSRT